MSRRSTKFEPHISVSLGRLTVMVQGKLNANRLTCHSVSFGKSEKLESCASEVLSVEGGIERYPSVIAEQAHISAEWIAPCQSTA